MLEVKKLTKRFGDKLVLRDVSFFVRGGECVGIMGPSGEGKSTIARIMCGSILPDRGTVYMDGEQVVAAGTCYDNRFRRRIQLVPQQPYAALDPRQRVGSAIAEPLLFHNLAANREQARKQACMLMEQVLLDPSLYCRRPGELSGGQAQRVLIARSLTLSPRILIADEATSMLDVSSQAQIIRIFRHLIEEKGMSVLLISHDHKLLESVSDRMYALQNGVLREIY